jgi:U3 small nucleolar RNA-associated protein 18
MPVKHAKKRLRTDNNSRSHVQPLGSVVTQLDDAEKDEEERHLESVLFGKPFISSTNGGLVSDEDEHEGEQDIEYDAGGREFENLLDSDVSGITCRVQSYDANVIKLFVLDAPVTATTAVDVNSDAIERDEDFDNVQSDNEQQQLEIPLQRNAAKGKTPAWTDPDDANLQISLSSNRRLRKLRDAAADDLVGGRDYERRLRRQYEKINPTPEWASVARKKLKLKRRRSSPSSTDEEDLFTSTDGILAGKITGKAPTLSSGTISIERLRDANISAKAEGDVNAVQFHPSTDVPILFTASADRRLRLFNVS